MPRCAVAGALGAEYPRGVSPKVAAFFADPREGSAAMTNSELREALENFGELREALELDLLRFSFELVGCCLLPILGNVVVAPDLTLFRTFRIFSADL